MSLHQFSILKSLCKNAIRQVFYCTTITILMSSSVGAAERIIFAHSNAEVAILADELQVFARDRHPSKQMQQFFDKSSEDVVQVWQALTVTFPLSPTSLEQNFSNSTDQFMLIQLDQVLGVQLRQENLEPLRSALASAYADDQRVSITELIEHYPAAEIRVDVGRLMQLYRALEPVVAIANQILPELACACVAPGISKFDWPKLETPILIDISQTDRKTNPCASQKAQWLDISKRLNSEFQTASQQLVLTYGVLHFSFSVEALEALAESGSAPAAWAPYFALANIVPEDLQTLLIYDITLDAATLDRILNSVVGEYGLFQIGQIVHTRSGQANIQALRAALMQSVLDDNRISLLEFLQHYPLSHLYVDGADLIRLSQQFTQLTLTESRRAEGNPVFSQDWLVNHLAPSLEERCDCDSAYL